MKFQDELKKLVNTAVGLTSLALDSAKELIEKATECGASMFSYGSELNMLANECKKIRGMF